jgi:hypothetical protein
MSAIERANVKWWLEVGLSFEELLGREVGGWLEKMNAAMQGVDDKTILRAIDEFLSRFGAPWDAV